MDHKQQLAKLDPKLKEAYDRVMGVNIPAPATPPNPQQPVSPPASPLPIVPPAPAVPFVVTAAATPPPAVQAVSPAQPLQPPLRRSTETVHVGYQLQKQKSAEKKGKIPPVIMVVGIAVFFVVYTFLWIKLFKIPVPFLGL